MSTNLEPNAVDFIPGVTEAEKTELDNVDLAAADKADRTKVTPTDEKPELTHAILCTESLRDVVDSIYYSAQMDTQAIGQIQLAFEAMTPERYYSRKYTQVTHLNKDGRLNIDATLEAFNSVITKAYQVHSEV